MVLLVGATLLLPSDIAVKAMEDSIVVGTHLLSSFDAPHWNWAKVWYPYIV
jgi:hypothetical protein